METLSFETFSFEFSIVGEGGRFVYGHGGVERCGVGQGARLGIQFEVRSTCDLE